MTVKLAEANEKSIAFLKVAGYPCYSLDAITNIGEIWSCVYSVSTMGKPEWVEVLVGEKGVMGFRKLKDEKA